MTKDRSADWDSLDAPQPDRLLESKRNLESLDSKRVGFEPDWKLRVIMLKERREERRSENHSLAARKQWESDRRRKAASETRAAAWRDGKYDSQRGAVRCPKMTELMLSMRADGMNNREIAKSVGLSYGAVWLRIGGQRSKPNRVEFDTKTVASMRRKGLSWARIARVLGCSERTVRDRMLSVSKVAK